MVYIARVVATLPVPALLSVLWLTITGVLISIERVTLSASTLIGALGIVAVVGTVHRITFVDV